MTHELKPLSEQTVVITGASSGIGLVTARHAVQRGARVVLTARSENALRQISEEINQSGGQSTYVAGDVASREDMERVAAEAHEKFGGFDTWINNAGVSVYGKFVEVSEEDHRQVFETNYWGVVNGSLVAVETLRTKGGAIINVGSALSDRAIPLQGTYCASKHAVKGFTDGLRMEVEHDNLPISVTLIKPASIDTPYIRHAKNYMDVEPQNPAPVYAPEVVAEAILYCAEHPMRDVFAGGGGKGLSTASYFAPRTTDKVMESVMFDSQRTDKPADRSRPDGLHQPTEDPRESGIYEGHVAKTSLYTKASMHPLVTASLLLGGAGLAYALTRQSGNGKSTSSQTLNPS